MYDVFPTKFPYKIFLNLACIPYQNAYCQVQNDKRFLPPCFIAMAHPVLDDSA